MEAIGTLEEGTEVEVMCDECDGEGEVELNYFILTSGENEGEKPIVECDKCGGTGVQTRKVSEEQELLVEVDISDIFESLEPPRMEL